MDKNGARPHNHNHYLPHKAAGHKVIFDFPRVHPDASIAEVEMLLVEKAREYSTIDYIYVIENEKLVGVVSVKEIFRSPKNVKVESVMRKDLVVAHPHTHQERLVYLALSHNLKAIPVVDEEHRMTGIVPYDTLLHIFNEEAHSDFLMFGGIFHKVGRECMPEKIPTGVMIRNRIPWLIVGTFGGLVTASIVTSFEAVLDKLLALAAFAPVLAYLSGAVGAQSETIAVRSLASEPNLSKKKYLLKELNVACFLALIIGLLLGFLAHIGWGDYLLAMIVGISMFFSIIASVLIATYLPFLFAHMKLDPALASGPLATMLGDIATIFLFFLIASLFIGAAGI